eukprot:CAMPEP_0203852200 /NCGR_PEP_ID=MMETSP0359-20131031/7782_1 /ASSEMBLY_ACC=CAM_ASM_000338 /TAXON_ID=268821 /ORGANISM="Scrippsiella Hangoei, Strain SHTV-5" /LENGTH=167 /DNA_ID=CAMNT_0050768307 /DNA_START=52 /DNA_END=555 /DNA_ORIENTATION=+
MSVVPPLIALAGGVVPGPLLNLMPELCPLKALLGSVFLYNMPHMVRMFYIHKGGDKLDNINPREQVQKLCASGKGDMISKAQSAHQNGLESFPPFAAGVLAATIAGVPGSLVGQLCSTHLFARLGFNITYIWGKGDATAAIRSSFWVLSLLCSCQLIAAASKKLGSK